MNTAVIVIIFIVGIALGIELAYVVQRGCSVRLKKRFGPEYSRTATVAKMGDRWRAESALVFTSDRLILLNEGTFWTRGAKFKRDSLMTQTGTLVEADRLIASVMSAEGYPIGDFEQRAADISVDHAEVVENYRGGHRIASKRRSDAQTPRI